MLIVAMAGSVAACGDDPASSVETLGAADFDERSGRLCTDHAAELEELFDTFDIMDAETDAEIESELERVQRELLARKRELLSELRQIEPEGRRAEWEDALDQFDVALDRASSGDTVDVRAKGIFESVTILTDDFGLGACF